MKRHWVRVRVSVCALALFCLGTNASFAVQWANPAGGNFADPGNWFAGGPPVLGSGADFWPFAFPYTLNGITGDVVISNSLVQFDYIHTRYPVTLNVIGSSVDLAGGGLNLEAPLRIHNTVETLPSVLSTPGSILVPGASASLEIGPHTSVGFTSTLNTGGKRLDLRALGGTEFTSVVINGNLDLGTPEPGGFGPNVNNSTVTVAGSATSFRVFGNLLDPGFPFPGGSPYPVYRIKVADAGFFQVTGNVDNPGPLSEAASIELDNGILEVASSFGSRDVKGHGVIVAPNGTLLPPSISTYQTGDVNLSDRFQQFRVDSGKTATVFSQTVARLPHDTLLGTAPGPLARITAPNGLILGSGDMLQASNGLRFIDGEFILENGILQAAPTGGGALTFSNPVAGYGLVINQNQTNISPTDPLVTSPGGQVELGFNLSLGANQGVIHSAIMARLATVQNDIQGGELISSRGMVLPAGSYITGWGIISGEFVGEATSVISVPAGQLLRMGTTASVPAFQTAGDITVDGTLQIDVPPNSFATLGGQTVLNAPGSAINANGVSLISGGYLQGTGSVNARFAAAAGSTINATGSMSLGISATNGYSSSGTMLTGNNTITLVDSNLAELGSTTILGNGPSPGILAAANGAVLDFGRAVLSFGTVQTPNSAVTPLINNGAISGTSAGQPITLPGFVKGVGTFNNVNFTGTFSPGLSPAELQVGAITLSPSNTLIAEIGGTTPGSLYDRIVSSSTISLGGVLDVDLINNFVPAIGNSFQILSATGGISGTFASPALLPDLAGGRVWNLAYAANSVTLSVGGVLGDYNKNGTVDAADYVVWRKSLGLMGAGLAADGNADNQVTDSDYNVWRANFGQVAPGAGTGSFADGSASAVPEPSFLLPLCVVLLQSAGRRTSRRRV
jgi:hypothetical protein